MRRERFERLDEALAAMREAAERVRGEGPLRTVKMLREFEPGDRVAARLEISTGGLLRRGSEAGLDVMGDGRLVPFAGGTRRRPLQVGDGEDPVEAIGRALG